MRVKLLPSSLGSKPQSQVLTTFLIDGRVAVDGGSLGLALDPAQMHAVRHVIVTHAHSDHTASLPIFVAEAFTSLDGPITIYGIPEVVEVLREYIFNDRIWPNFERIALSNNSDYAVRFEVLEPRERVEIAGLSITPIPVNHTVPCSGLLVEEDGVSVLFTSDTYSTDEIWEAASASAFLKAIFVDVSYPAALEELARASKHFTPRSLAADLVKLRRQAEIYAVHIKPSNREQVIQELEELFGRRVMVAESGRMYEWLGDPPSQSVE